MMIKIGDEVVLSNNLSLGPNLKEKLSKEKGKVVDIDKGENKIVCVKFKNHDTELWFNVEEIEKAKVKNYEQLGKEIGQLVGEKNEAYGDSFATSGEFLKLLYPDGIDVEDYTDALCLVRIFDKCKRIATQKKAFDESPYKDIAGYGLLGAMKDSDSND